MPLLASCWKQIVSVIIPIDDGQAKWLVLSYFINPLVLVCCQFYLFGKLITNSVLVLFSYPIKVARWMVIVSFGFFTCSMKKLVVMMELDDASIIRLYGIGAPRERWYDFLATGEDDEEDTFLSMVPYKASREFPSNDTAKTIFEYPSDGFRGDVQVSEEKEEQAEQEERWQLNEEKEEQAEKEERWQLNEEKEEQTEQEERRQLNEEKEEQAEQEGGWQPTEEQEEQAEQEGEWQVVVLPEPEEDDSITGGEGENTEEQSHEEDDEISLRSTMTSYAEDGDQDAEISSLSQQNTGITIWETRRKELMEAETDEFYKEYMRRMNFFDQLNSQGICYGQMLGIDLRDPALLEVIEDRIHSLAGYVDKGLLCGIVTSFETVYVAQSCLSWETLHHQYRKVETLASSVSTGGQCAFDGAVVGKFQQFQVLLERFTESSRLQQERFLNYANERFSSGYLLQVPSVTGYMAEARENQNEGTVKARELLKAIEKAIIAFRNFLEEEKIKQPRKLRKQLSIDSQVENPNDMEILFKLVKNVKKKERDTNHLQSRRSRLWEKKKHLVEAGQSNDMMFGMIDIKLVSRVLKMSVISTQQLKWCEEKLGSIQAQKGLLIRNSTASLFPES